MITDTSPRKGNLAARICIAPCIPFICAFSFIVELGRGIGRGAWFAWSNAKQNWNQGWRFVRTGKME